VSEQEFVDYLADNGWDVEWISILEEDAGSGTMSQAEAADWASDYGLDPASVLFDADQTWYAQAVPSGFPTVYTVHTTNMLIWDRTDGWIDSSGADWDGFLEWWPSFLAYCDSQAGS
jgi:hypothetical protein